MTADVLVWSIGGSEGLPRPNGSFYILEPANLWNFLGGVVFIFKAAIFSVDHCFLSSVANESPERASVVINNKVMEVWHYTNNFK
jgi:hypothetical protein